MQQLRVEPERHACPLTFEHELLASEQIGTGIIRQDVTTPSHVTLTPSEAEQLVP
ncbi:hypothetical protein D187_009036 [Cystobacter fuscus DSM 2262]|uniref:Uncharacterized protein n=1 Tax=Cystobacter fuscus (strain ATCC 25194 / DSM 2262 / NBRC 100088 / M29) TaxID=1242864 RepID=S9NTF7_CYSF2|nr:hypothetical protein D187_009036 [Cystobacter fuscus DSM 2262]